MTLVKVFFTFPIFIIFFLSFFLKKKKFKKSPRNFTEEKRYKWTKRYSRYLLWINGQKFKLINSDLWDAGSGIVFVKTNSFVLPLFIAKENNFEKQSPFIFAFSDKKIVKNKFLIDFYSFLKPLYLDSFSKESSDEWIEKIKIPRMIFYFYDEFNSDNIKKMLFLASSAYSKIIFTESDCSHKRKLLILKEKISPSQIVNLDLKFLEEKIRKMKWIN